MAHPPPDPQHVARRTVYTVGHSNGPADGFLRLLQAHGIEVLVDVRSRPFSKYAAQFNAEPLREALTAAGIKYLPLGKELGGRPEGAAFYDAEGHVLYGRVAEAPFFRQGIARLEAGMQKYRVVLMCSEEDPSGCHRHRLIARVLTGRGITVLHIRGDGALQTEADLVAQTAPPPGAPQQLALFDPQEITVWRSARSVLRKEAPPTSSER